MYQWSHTLTSILYGFMKTMISSICNISSLGQEKKPIHKRHFTSSKYKWQRNVPYITVKLCSSGDRDGVEISKFSKGSERISTGSIQSAGSCACSNASLIVKVLIATNTQLEPSSSVLRERQWIFALGSPAGLCPRLQPWGRGPGPESWQGWLVSGLWTLERQGRRLSILYI